jgi:hypothetical protein
MQTIVVELTLEGAQALVDFAREGVADKKAYVKSYPGEYSDEDRLTLARKLQAAEDACKAIVVASDDLAPSLRHQI